MRVSSSLAPADSPSMAITLGAEIALPMHFDDAINYSDLETALTDAGFTDYTIMRTINFDGTADAQVFVRGATNPDGSQVSLPAASTMEMLTAAVTALDATHTSPA